MNLAYLWIKNEYKNGQQNQGYNFYGKYAFFYDDTTNELIIKENKGYIDDFYTPESGGSSNIDMLTCIVGDNGSGKTTLLENIKFFSAGRAFIDYFKNDYVAVFCNKNGKSCSFYYSYGYSEAAHLKIIFKTKIDIEKVSSKEDFTKNLAVIHYANYFDETAYYNTNPHDMEGYYDERTNTLINYYAEKHREIYHSNNLEKMSIYQLEELKKKISFFLCNNQAMKKLFDNFFRKLSNNNDEDLTIMRDKLMIEPFTVDYQGLRKLFEKRFANNSQIIEYLDSINSYFIERQNEELKNIDNNCTICNSKKRRKRITVYQRWLFSYNMWILFADKFSMEWESLSRISNNLTLNSDYEIKNLKKMNQPFAMTEHFIAFAKKSLGSIKIEGASVNTNDFDNLKGACKEFLSLIEKTMVYNQNIRGNNQQIILSLKDKESEKLSVQIAEQYFFTEVLFSVGTFCRFSWSPQLSTGENALLTLFSRLYSAMSHIKNDEKQLLILLDEPDIGFHPYWSKQYIAALLEFFKFALKRLNKQDLRLQLIFTTNNPMPLSDIQNNDVVYLKNHSVISNIEIKTFGTDLLTLFSDSFFISDGLIGRFAKSKINSIIDYCQDKDNNIKFNDYKKITSLIGDDFIKEYLLELLENKKRSQ